jgi:hypothetical protein
MKKYVFIIVAFLMMGRMSFSQTTDGRWKPYVDTVKMERVHDSLKRTVISIGYQPAIGGDFAGAGIYIHGIVSVVGVYASFTGLESKKTGDKDSPVLKDILLFTGTNRNWNTINFGISIKTAENFYIYGGYSSGTFTDWTTDTYTHTAGSKTSTYTVVTKNKSNNPGADFGAMYYAGKGTLRFALQLGFNTSMKSVIAGIQMGFFIK